MVRRRLARAPVITRSDSVRKYEFSMPDRRLQVFLATAQQLSFTKAAETLQMSQPAVTFQIRQLEEEFNSS